MKQSSLFEAIAPIMIGPSSSHTAGAVRLGLLAKNIYDNPIKKLLLHYTILTLKQVLDMVRIKVY